MSTQGGTLHGRGWDKNKKAKREERQFGTEACELFGRKVHVHQENNMSID